MTPDDFFSNPLCFKKIIFREKEYYPDLINDAISKTVGFLAANKHSNSPFVYLFARNHIKTIIAYFAIIKAGKICVLVNPNIGAIELQEMMQDTPPYAEIKYEQHSEGHNVWDDITFTTNNLDVDTEQLKDVCTMKYTAAEDGYEKAVMLTKKNVFSNAEAIVYHSDIYNNTSCLALLPFHTMYGLQTGFLGPILSKGTVLIEDILKLSKIRHSITNVQKFTITHIWSVPLVYYYLSKVPDIKKKTNTVSVFISGGYSLPDSIDLIFFNDTGKRIHNGYGITEASPICTCTMLGKENKPQSVGQTFQCCRLKILNNADIEEPIGTVGEICVKGTNIMKGYYNHFKITQTTIINGWLHTGDLGKMDKDGYLYFCGLKKRMFNVAGQNVYPAEVERFIKMHDAVQDVTLSATPDAITGDDINARIVLKNGGQTTVEEIRAWCRQKISSYKIPRKIELLQ